MNESTRRPCIGAIVNNEGPYLPQWFAFYLSQGFEHFYIGDHDSDDETSALLESLEALGYVTRLFHARRREGSAQVDAYTRIVELASQTPSFVAFVDADEYLIPTRDDERAAPILAELLAPEAVGAVGINWLTFGAAGRIEPGTGLLFERFLACNDFDAGLNRHIKSVVKPESVTSLLAHRAKLRRGYHYVDSAGVPRPFDECSGFARDIPVIDGRLRVYHYVIKSYREFMQRKAYRGRANKGTATVRSHEFFHKANRDSGTQTCYRALRSLQATRERMADLERKLADTNYGRTLVSVDVKVESGRISGQLIADAPLNPARLTLVDYQNDDAREWSVKLGAPVALGLGTENDVNCPGLRAYPFDLPIDAVRDDSKWRSDALRLRLSGHRQHLCDTRRPAALPASVAAGPEHLQYAGAIDRLSALAVSGWVRRLDDTEPVVVEVFQGDKPLTTQVAAHFRADLIVHHKHPTGLCGFDIDLSCFPASSDDIITVRVHGTSYFLEEGGVGLGVKFVPAEEHAPPATHGVTHLLNRESQRPTEATFVVMGTSRAGIAAVAQCLEVLGIPMTEPARRVSEGLSIGKVIDGEDAERLRRAVTERNRSLKWGFRRPVGKDVPSHVAAELRRPSYVVVLGDLLALGNRHSMGVDHELAAGLSKAIADSSPLVASLSELHAPTLLLSYERALIDPTHLVEALADFAGVFDAALRNDAVSFVRNEARRDDEHTGRIEKVRDGQVIGWAVQSGDSPPRVRFLHNGRLVGEVIAIEPRDDVCNSGVPSTRVRGFRFALPEGVQLETGDRVRARVCGQTTDLANSPYLVRPAAVRPAAERALPERPVAARPNAERPRAVRPVAVRPTAVQSDGVRPAAVRPDTERGMVASPVAVE